MAGTISQRISLEGSEDIRKKLEALGAAGEQAFKQIQDAAKKPISDPAQIDKTKESMNELAAAATKLGPQFQALATSARAFGTEGAKATQQVTTGLNQTGEAAQQAGAAIQQAGQQASTAGQSAGGGLISAATAFKIAAVGIVAAIAAVTDALTKGAVESGNAIAAQAEKIGLSIQQWLDLRKGILSAGLSADDFAGKTSKIGELMKGAAGGIARVNASMTEQAIMTQNGIVVVTRFNDTLTNTSSGANKAATELRKLGVSWDAIMSGDTNRALREAAEKINAIPDAAKRAEAGLSLFGKEWEKIIAVLTGAQKIDPFKAGRDLSADQIEKTVKLKAAWDDLSNATRAFKDQIGALFLDPALARAEWLTKLIDGSRELFKIWAGLSDLGKEDFLAGLGDSPAEQVFRVLIAVGQQLAGIWRDILVPAGQTLVKIFKEMFGSFEGMTKSQITAFFVTATVAAISLAAALKGIALVLAPLTALISLVFSPFGLVLATAAAAAALFWDKLKAGADAVLAIIPQQVGQIKQALAALFTGDFAGAWALFREAASTALEDIGRKLQTTKGIIGDFFRALTGGIVELPWVQTLVNGLKQIGTDFPATIALILQGLVALGNAATTVANVINKIFGTQLTGTDIAAILIIAQLTGGLQTLASVAVITGAAIGILATGISTFVGLIGGVPVAIGLIAVALAGLIVWLDPGVWTFYANTAKAAMDLIRPAVEAVSKAISTLTGQVGGGDSTSAWGIFRDAALSALNPIWSALKAILNLIELVKQGLGKAREMQAPGAPLPAPGGTPMARGGLLGGVGTGTSDSNLAWLSRGEYITPARAVAQPGVLSFLEALRRSGGNLRSVLDGMGRFALGGMVPRMQAFAAGGLAGGMSNVTIQFPGLPAIGGLRASSDVVEQLHRAAALAQVRSGGRKPSRYS